MWFVLVIIIGCAVPTRRFSETQISTADESPVAQNVPCWNIAVAIAHYIASHYSVAREQATSSKGHKQKHIQRDYTEQDTKKPSMSRRGINSACH